MRIAGRVWPLPTVMEVGKKRGVEEIELPSLDAMWDEAPESITHCMEGFRDMALSARMRPAWSH